MTSRGPFRHKTFHDSIIYRHISIDVDTECYQLTLKYSDSFNLLCVLKAVELLMFNVISTLNIDKMSILSK